MTYLCWILLNNTQIKNDLYDKFCYLIRSSYSDFSAKYAKDERFKGIDKTRERELIFSDYLGELRHKEKEESRTQREKVFILLFHHMTGL